MANFTKAANSADPLQQPALRASVKDGMSQAAMMGCGETYFSAYAVFLNATPWQIGILGTLPTWIGAFFQLAGAVVIERGISRKKMLTSSAICQAILLLILGSLPFIFGTSSSTVSWVLALVVLYHSAAGLFAPIWSSLIGDLIPADLRGAFFGERSKKASLVTLVALLVAGQFLQVFEGAGQSALGFLFIFAAACCARLLSAYWLTRYTDPQYNFESRHRFTILQFIRKLPRSNFGRFVLFFSLMNFSLFVAAPYYSVYLLRDLKLSYAEYTMFSATASLVQILTFQYWGKLTDIFGNKKILEFCAFGVAVLPFGWLFGAQLWYLLILQIFSGFLWAGYNLSASNFLFDAVSPPKRARCVAYQSLINGFCVLSGSLLGAWLVTNIGPELDLSAIFGVPASVYPVLFLSTTTLRTLTVVFLLKLFREVREVKVIRHRDLLFAIAQIRPLAGITFSPITDHFRKPKK